MGWKGRVRPEARGLEACGLVQLPRIADERGCLGVIESNVHVPFSIERVYYLYGTQPGQSRGGHGHRELRQLFVALAGAFDVSLDDGRRRATYHLSDPAVGLYVGPMIWRTLNRFSENAVCAVIASAPYDERDYFRRYEDFLEAVRGA